MSRWIRRRLLAGILVLVPLGITVFVVKFVFGSLDRILAPVVQRIWGEPVPGVGLVALVLLVLLVGVAVRSFVGSRVVGLYEGLLARVPFARGVYGAAKQLTEALSTAGAGSFRTVVLVEFPRPGSWAVGFVICESKGEVQARTPEFLTNVFVPTTPNPTSGFLLMVPEHNLIHLDMTVEEGVKLMVSGGLVAPAWKEKIPRARPEMESRPVP